jgi:hypothetical protein
MIYKNENQFLMKIPETISFFIETLFYVLAALDVRFNIKLKYHGDIKTFDFYNDFFVYNDIPSVSCCFVFVPSRALSRDLSCWAF